MTRSVCTPPTRDAQRKIHASICAHQHAGSGAISSLSRTPDGQHAHSAVPSTAFLAASPTSEANPPKSASPTGLFCRLAPKAVAKRSSMPDE
eukprot:3437364-Prymnesium_polylepis.2